MSDHRMTTSIPVPPEPGPCPPVSAELMFENGPARSDAETTRPFREAFARRLPPDVRRELERQASEAYAASLEAPDSPYAFPDASDTRGRLKAAVVDLRETAALLAEIAAEHLDTELESRDTALCLLAAARRLEVEAVAERVEALLTYQPTPTRPFPAELASACLTPSG